MAYLKNVVVFLFFGLILSFFLNQSTAQHLRWGKRNDLTGEDGIDQTDEMIKGKTVS